MDNEQKNTIRERILHQQKFARALFSGEQKGASLQWEKVIIRAVEIKGGIQLQFSYFDGRKDISKNYEMDKAASPLNELLDLPFRNIFIEGGNSNLQVNISKKGKVLMNEVRPSAPVTVDLSHNRQKNRILSVENAEPFLKAVGILTQDGRVKADMQRKFTQINDFLRLVSETDFFESFKDQPVHVVDFGCGNAYLTFAIYYYLHDILNLDAHVAGIDIKIDLIERHQQKAQALGWEQLSFHAGQIADFHLEVKPDVVLALHACDTATDDALASAIRWESGLILCAPCCQHDLQAQMSKAELPDVLQPVLQHGIFFERMGDILTDTFRALILKIMGYRTDVTEFVPIEHTARNLMIRSVKTSAPGNEQRAEEYRGLKSFWGVTPYLERLLGGEYEKFL